MIIDLKLLFIALVQRTFLLIDWLNSNRSWSQRSSPWSLIKCSEAQRKTAQNIVHTTTKKTLRRCNILWLDIWNPKCASLLYVPYTTTTFLLVHYYYFSSLLWCRRKRISRSLRMFDPQQSTKAKLIELYVAVGRLPVRHALSSFISSLFLSSTWDNTHLLTK